MTQPLPTSLEEQLRCAKRELAMRRTVYPGMILKSALTEGTARRELAAMAAIVETLTALVAQEREQERGQGELFAWQETAKRKAAHSTGGS